MMTLRNIDNSKVIPQPGDGNCLFHSISFYLNDQTTAASLRNEVCIWMNVNRTRNLSDGIPLYEWIRYESPDIAINFDDYIAHMSTPRSYGSTIEIKCISIMKMINIHVYQRFGNEYKVIEEHNCSISSDEYQTIHLLYNKNIRHYEVLLFDEGM